VLSKKWFGVGFLALVALALGAGFLVRNQEASGEQSNSRFETVSKDLSELAAEPEQ
jgi:hypothetical protein